MGLCKIRIMHIRYVIMHAIHTNMPRSDKKQRFLCGIINAYLYDDPNNIVKEVLFTATSALYEISASAKS